MKSYFFSKLAPRKSQHANSRKRLHRGTDLRVEPLEPRWLLSANEIAFDPSTSQIIVTGTTGNDEVLVSAPTPDLIHVRMRNSEGTLEADFQRAVVASVSFAGDAGDDTFANSTDLRSFASGGAGDDTLVGGNGVDTFQGDAGNDLLYGYAGNDALYGGGGNDRLLGGNDDDTLGGGGGDDTLQGDAGSDLLYGYAGNDALYGGEGNDRLLGGNDDDTLVGADGDDTLLGGEGSDLLHGYAGKDILSGDEGNDRLFGGNDDDTLVGGDGNDTILGEDGNDLLYGYAGKDDLNAGQGNDRLFGGNDDDSLVGGDGDDTLLGDEGNDLLYGYAGKDILSGGDGNDRLLGGNDDDTLVGGDGDDTLTGEAGNDLLYGYAGKDVLKGDEGNDRLFGGNDDDSLVGGDGDDLLLGEAGNDLLHGYAGKDILSGDEGIDRLLGGNDDDTLVGGNGDDTLLGEAGDDLLYGYAGKDDLNAGQGNDKLFGGNDDDTLLGDDGDDLLLGDAGNDLLYGYAGNDILGGGEGNDHLYGGNDHDTLVGADGDDTLMGETGNDLHYGYAGKDALNGGDGNDRLHGGNDDDTLAGADGDDTLTGEAGNDLLYGYAGEDLLNGNDGNDQLFGGDGNDLLMGGSGNDLLKETNGNNLFLAGNGDDELYGGVGNDVLVGQSGNDRLFGIHGSNILFGGADRDDITGGPGDDLLVGGSTTYDANAAALQILLQVWSSGASYADRIAAIESESISARLESGETVIDDQIADAVYGGDGLDWFFLTGSVPVYSPVMSQPDHGHEHGDHHHDVHLIHTLPALEGFALIDSLDKLADMQANESLHSKMPHATNGVKQREHLSLFELVRYDQITHFAIADGNWSDPATWLNGKKPTEGARVAISYGIHVTVDDIIKTRLATVRVDGTLSFATQVSSELRVDTIVVTASGAFEMGTEDHPIAPTAKARLLITGNGPIDRSWDPFGLSRGLLSHGRATIYGRTVLAKSALEGAVLAGTNWLRLTDSPQGWKVGDYIVIAGTVAGGEQDEVRKILSINGDSVRVAPLTYDHVSSAPHMLNYVAHLSRNAVIESENSAADRRGHVMFMHSRDVEVQYAGFYRLGRTDKLQVINDPVVDSNWVLEPGTGTNPRARYPVHFHRNGLVDDGNPVLVNGSVVLDAPGWGFVNHSSYVDFTDNVAYDVTGAAFATEVGDEIGSFRGNIAIRVPGSGEESDSRTQQQDFGHEGVGFWFQGAGISVTDNVSAGSDGSAFAIYGRGLREGGVVKQFRSENLIDPSIANGADMINVQFVPIREFARNTGLASNVGLDMRYHLRSAPHNQTGTIEDSIFWNNLTGVSLHYSQQTVLTNLTIVQEPSTAPSIGIRGNAISRNIIYDNLTVSGYTWGINVARAGNALISGGYYNNLSNFVIGSPSSNDRTVLITGPIVFGKLPNDVVRGNIQTNVYMRSDLPSGIDSIFYSNSVILNFGPFNNQRAYYALQHPTAVPFPNPGEGIPAVYIGKTTRQLRDQFGLTVGGGLAPLTAVPVPGVRGLVAPAKA